MHLRTRQWNLPPHDTPGLFRVGKIWVYVLGELAGGACAGLLSWPLCEWEMFHCDVSDCMWLTVSD